MKNKEVSLTSNNHFDLSLKLRLIIFLKWIAWVELLSHNNNQIASGNCFETN